MNIYNLLHSADSISFSLSDQASCVCLRWREWKHLVTFSLVTENTLSPFLSWLITPCHLFFSWLKTPRHLYSREWKHLVTFSLVAENTLWPLLSWLKTPCDLFSRDWKHLVTDNTASLFPVLAWTEHLSRRYVFPTLVSARRGVLPATWLKC